MRNCQHFRMNVWFRIFSHIFAKFCANNFASIWRNVWNQIFILKFEYFASSRGIIIAFRSKMSKKWFFTFKNFQNVYLHGKRHSALVRVFFPSLYYISKIQKRKCPYCWQIMDCLTVAVGNKMRLQLLLFLNSLQWMAIINTMQLYWCVIL